MRENRFSKFLAAAVAITAAIVPSIASAAEIPALAWTPRSDWVNAKTAFGVVGDGVHDDAPNIQAALNATGGGQTLYFPPGTYKVGTTLAVDPSHAPGVAIIGSGRDTVFSWAGPEGGSLIIGKGGSRNRFIGFVLDGHGVAASGFDNADDPHTFDTESRWQDIAFRNFTGPAYQSNPKAGSPMAETSIENCIFDNCGTGVYVTKFNDYDFDVVGCDFKNCGVGIGCLHGNFYARDCFFQGSKQSDVFVNGAEHGCSVRRCKSTGSAQFIDYTSAVSPLSIEDCYVSGWMGAGGAISLNAPPVTLHQVTFTGAPNQSSPIHCTSGQIVMVSGVKTPSGAALFAEPKPVEYDVPTGATPGYVSVHGREIDSFVNGAAVMPSKIFDAVTDFGAKGDGQTDDTAALQKAIDAAAAYGNGALAYVPHGKYIVTGTLTLTGGGYAFGGSGLRSALVWKGPAGADIVSVADPKKLRIENIAIGHGDYGQMNDAYDIDVSSSSPGNLVCDGVYVWGMYQKVPAVRGLRLNSLAAGSTVVLEHFQGNLNVVNSARAIVLGNDTYEGAITVDDSGSSTRDGFLGFMMRLSTGDVYPLVIKHSSSIILSDYYTEQGWNGALLSGEAGDKPGLVVISGPKSQFSPNPTGPGHFLVVDNYRGALVYGPEQFYTMPKQFDIAQTGNNPFDLIFLGNSFYGVKLAPSLEASGRLAALGNQVRGPQSSVASGIAAAPADVTNAATLPAVTAAYEQFAKLGQWDLALNFGWLK